MAATAEFIVHGDYVLPMDGSHAGGVIRNAAVAIGGGCVIEVGPFRELSVRHPIAKQVGGQGRAVLPGLVNAHTHAAMVFMRGLADDMPLKEWLEGHIWPIESKLLNPEFIRDAVRLACAEMIRAGVTSFCDMYFYEDVAAEVIAGAGMRAVLGPGIIDFPTSTTTGADDCLQKADAFIEKYKGHPLIAPSVAAHSEYACSADTLGKVRALADRHGVLMQIHLSEAEWEVTQAMQKYGMRPAEHLESIGFLADNLLASHCVWLSPAEIELIAKRGVSVAHCAESNLKLASGIAPVPDMIDAGVCVGLGTDGAASNNDLDLMAEMSLVAKLHKAIRRDPTCLDASTALSMATAWGAKAAGLANTGTITPGANADIIVIDLRKPHLAPIYDVRSHLVYSANSSDVESVFIAGRPVLLDGKLLSIDEEAVLARSAEWAGRIRKELSLEG